MISLKIFAIFFTASSVALNSFHKDVYLPIEEFLLDSQQSTECDKCMDRVVKRESSKFSNFLDIIESREDTIRELVSELKSKRVKVQGEYGSGDFTICFNPIPNYLIPSSPNSSSESAKDLAKCLNYLKALGTQNADMSEIVEINSKSVAAFTERNGECHQKRFDLLNHESETYKGLLLPAELIMNLLVTDGLNNTENPRDGIILSNVMKFGGSLKRKSSLAARRSS